MGLFSLVRDDRAMLVGLGIASVGIFVGMRAVLLRFRDSSEIKPIQPKLRYITQETEDALPAATLGRLLGHYNYSIRETTAKIVCDRAVNDPLTLQLLLWGITRDSYEERMKNLRALAMLTDLDSLHLLDTPTAYSAFVRSLQLCVGETQYDMIDDDFFDEYYLRDIAEKLCLMFVDQLVHKCKHGVDRLVHAGFVDRWLAKQRWGTTDDQRIDNFDRYLRFRGNRIADICKRLYHSPAGYAALERARLVRPHSHRHHRHYRLYDCPLEVPGERETVERHPVQTRPEPLTDQERRADTSSQDDSPPADDESQTHDAASAQTRQHGQNTQEGQRIRRQHREAMVLNDGTRPLRRDDIFERESDKRLPTSSRGSGISSVSTPNLGSLFASHARLGQAQPPPPLPPVPPPLLIRKASVAALTSSSLATIPDDTEFYAFDTLNEPLWRLSLGPGSSLPTGPDVAVGDAVDVPGGLTGVVRFVGSVAGRRGVFAGVELHSEYASRGKNSGDVDGISYFSTATPGAGIFLPVSKAQRRDSTVGPLSPTASGIGLKLGNQNSTNYTPPTPSLSKFSQSMSAASASRASSPQGKRPSLRTSLSRPESPVRRMQMTPVPQRPSITPAPGRFASPTNKFSQSLRAPSAAGVGDPSKRGLSLRPDYSNSIGPRSVSALGAASVSSFDDDVPPMGLGRTRVNGAGGSGSANGPIFEQRERSPSHTLRSPSRAMRPPSRASNANYGSPVAPTAMDAELERLRAELEDRERQLKEQANTLADMESSLTELQTLMDSPDGPMGTGGGGDGGVTNNRRDSVDDKDTAQLRALLRERNEKIAMLTAEFDTHRADFRSTIDTLEMASTETERVYEKKIEDLMQEIHELESRTTDVDAVAQQLKQLEELVQELEEGLEDARRGEAEARGEVEFLRGEVERTRTELRREREKLANGNGNSNGHAAAPGSMQTSKELEQKDDEIRGLKAIIHSLSRNAGAELTEKDSGAVPGSPSKHRRGESINERMAREKLEREVSDLHVLLERKSARETEMELELEQLRLGGGAAPTSSQTHHIRMKTASSRSSLRDSRDTMVLPRELHETTAGGGGSRSPDLVRKVHHARGATLDTMPESDAYSSVTDASTLWCEICEANGHDILTCTNMFGPQNQQNQQNQQSQQQQQAPQQETTPDPSVSSDIRTGKDQSPTETEPTVETNGHEPSPLVAPLSPARTTTPTAVPAEVKILPNPLESGPVAGKESGMIDTDKWCALCERDGHDSVDCPFEDAF
ncbi:cytoskeleton-associated protein [Grosmannia clavigera kw1407]|uniref:Cytoskeleton-associated protein n=1 Tax=Grosmannia clavigera (strain kw1407 / UAMH 11150) TaxID=655863 RepID=F0XR62_GROCL|nr:cytoskeleton-associated protein [Grosmannia clavigera kw1407]EFW99961.1 cytoskeleton-associated protein [Grosmannia clavigera kw1407]